MYDREQLLSCWPGTLRGAACETPELSAVVPVRTSWKTLESFQHLSRLNPRETSPIRTSTKRKQVPVKIWDMTNIIQCDHFPSWVFRNLTSQILLPCIGTHPPAGLTSISGTDGKSHMTTGEYIMWCLEASSLIFNFRPDHTNQSSVTW